MWTNSVSAVKRHAIYPVARAMLAVLLIGGIGGCSVNPVTGSSDFVLMSEDAELAMGRQSHGDILKKFGRYDAPALQDYVSRIGRQLAAHSHRSNLVYRFTVLDSKDVNAFALPGGYIYITRGLMAFLNSEAELAAVLGHEIGHVTARHGVRQASAAQAAGLGAALGAVLFPELGTQAARSTINLLGTSLLRGYGRKHELEADKLGAEYLARSGYDPAAMLDVIRVLKAQEIWTRRQAQQEGEKPATYHGLFATHPDNDTRLQEVVLTARQLRQGKSYRTGRDRYLEAIEGLAYGDNVNEGVIRNGLFLHADIGFSIRFPRQWRIENKPDRVLAHAPDGGALLQMTVADINRRQSARQFLRQRLKPEGLRDGEPIQVGTLPAYTATAITSTPWGQRRSRIAVVMLGERALIFTGATRAANGLATFDAFYRQTVQSVRRLTARQRKAIEPLHVHIVRANNKTRFSRLAANAPTGTHSADLIRLLNGRYPRGPEPRPGERLKTIR